MLALMSLFCVLGASLATYSGGVTWEVQVQSNTSFFQTVSMCKGTTPDTNRIGFIGNELGGIFRTLDGKNWEQVAQISEYSYWYGVYCFPDAKKIIAVGFSDGDPNYQNNAMFIWSVDGGNTWSDRHHLSGGTWLQSVTFHNETHGVILPLFQQGYPEWNTIYYYTTTGGLVASDWKTIEVDTMYLSWMQGHSLWNSGGPVMKSIAQSSNDSMQWSDTCTSNDFGATWDCKQNHPFGLQVTTFVSETEGLGVGYEPNVNSLLVYSTKDGGLHWTKISRLSVPLTKAIVIPTDMLWIPNTKSVVLVGGNDYPQFVGAALQSTDGGMTWQQVLPTISGVWFGSVDYAMSSPSTAEVYVVGIGNSNYILHATVPV